MTLVCKSVGIWDGIVKPIYGCGVEITPDINPIYVGIEMSFPDNSKNVSFIDMGLEKAVDNLKLLVGGWAVWLYIGSSF